MANLKTNILVHELADTADLDLRKHFYDDIVNLSFSDKKEISEVLAKDIPGAEFRPVSAESIIKDQITPEDVASFKREGYIYPYKIDADVVTNILNRIKGLELKNTWRGQTIKGSSILDDNNFLAFDDSLGGTYWLTEEQKDYSNLINDKVFQDLAFDPMILEIVSQYLGTTPIHVATNVWFSATSGDETEQSRNAQFYHQDAGFVQFVKVFIYLSDTNLENGPHHYIRSSHAIDPRDKIENYITSQRYSDDELESAYGKSNLVPILGRRGEMIFGDTSCFHKGGSVISGGRLMLNLEYCSTLFWFWS